MSQTLALQLVDELHKALAAEGVKSLAIGEVIFKLQKSRAYLDLGYRNFNAFLETECHMKTATASRYAYKYEISAEYPEYRDKIGKAPIVSCEHTRRLLKLEGGKSIVDKFIDKIDKMSIDEIKKLYAGLRSKTKQEDMHYKRISATFIESEYEEFLELEDLIMKGFDLENRREVILNSMREVAEQARDALRDAQGRV